MAVVFREKESTVDNLQIIECLVYPKKIYGTNKRKKPVCYLAPFPPFTRACYISERVFFPGKNASSYCKAIYSLCTIH
eukprot:TRINITY_DN4939_c0_g1_i1.p1 TRINITY_DN4939_c0_g1~~TRINITY_DN4939_c0_g1_i1.p1  ORF type:complete len:78 (+),score=2.17 TRINITY_DN4939_c0_g1_i1:311-544(+)